MYPDEDAALIVIHKKLTNLDMIQTTIDLLYEELVYLDRERFETNCSKDDLEWFEAKTGLSVGDMYEMLSELILMAGAEYAIAGEW